MSLAVIHSTGQTKRYGSHPILSRLLQTDADHTWGMLAILFELNPNPSIRLIKAMTYHDCGEKWAGDLPADFKRRFPAFAKAHAKLEHQLAAENGIPLFVLDPEEALWLSLLDQLEAYLFVQLMTPWIVQQPKWKKQRTRILEASKYLNITQELFE